MTPTRRAFVVGIAAATAGCSGWGADGPADQDQSNKTNDTTDTTEAETTPAQETDEDEQDPREDDGEPETSGNDGVDDDPAQEAPQEPQNESEPEPDRDEDDTDESERSDSEPAGQNDTDPLEGDQNESGSQWTDQPATAVIRVTRPDGAPVVGEPVAIANAAMIHDETRRTDQSGEVTITMTVDSADDVVTFFVSVGAETRKLIIASDEAHGVQSVEFVLSPEPSVPSNESNSSGTEANETRAANETTTALLEVMGVGR